MVEGPLKSIPPVAPLFFVIALIYTSAGLGGGSAYIALLSFMKIEHVLIPSTALFLNMVSSFTGFMNFRTHFDRRKIHLYISVYAAGVLGVYLGANLGFSENLFYIILGVALISSSVLSMFREKMTSLRAEKLRNYIPVISFFVGCLAGITGIGGGIYLSPILLVAGFPVKEVASITSLYIFINSFFGFSSHYIKGNADFSFIFPLVFFVLAGAFLGSYLGSFKYRASVVRTILNLIIISAGGRLLWKGISITVST